MMRPVGFFLFASAYWALLPQVAASSPGNCCPANLANAPQEH
jgi:hypothetical protein